LTLRIQWIILYRSHIRLLSHQHLNSLPSAIDKYGKSYGRCYYYRCYDTSTNSSSCHSKRIIRTWTFLASIFRIASLTRTRALRGNLHDSQRGITVYSQALISLRNSHRGKHASDRGIAGIVGAGIIIVAADEHVLTTLLRVARIRGARVLIVAAYRSEHASGISIARVGGADVSIVAWRDGSEDAGTVGLLAGSDVTEVGRRAVVRDELASGLRALDYAGIGSARIIISTEDGSGNTASRYARTRTAWIRLRARKWDENTLGSSIIRSARIIGAEIIVVTNYGMSITFSC